MKIRTVLWKSMKTWARHFGDLMGAYLIQAVLRTMCFVPLMFLWARGYEYLAWLCVPMYLLIALPARQNYALAMQDMLQGGRVLSPRLISFDGYFRKLWRGVKGTLKMAVWAALPLLAVTTLVQFYLGEGVMSGTVMRAFGIMEQDGFSVMRWFKLFGSDTVDGVKNVILAVGALCILPVIGCAAHCGVRHALALEDKKLLKGQRLKLTALWVLGFCIFLPCAAVVLFTLGSNLKLFVSGFVQMFLSQSITIPELGERLYVIGGAIVLLFIPLVPLKQLIPAVAVHQQMLSTYKEIETDVEA